MSDFTERKERNKQVIVLAMVKALEHLKAAEAKLETAATLCGYGAITNDIAEVRLRVKTVIDAATLATKSVQRAEAIHM